ncbi:MAG: hypothetical protein GY715_20695 [Planctomycetes bacterium]|nr:hypothetical protein [Planctomycetota bacterium]
MTSSPFRGGLRHVVISVAILLVVGVVLRVGSGVASLEASFDEPGMQSIVERIVTEGWSVAAAVDYEDTKGPAFFWLYALPAEVTGADVGSLRLLSVAFFVLAGIPLGLIAVLCGLRPGQTAGAATLYALLPYNAVLGQLFMSEPSFLLGALLLLLVFAWSMAAEPGGAARRLGPVLFGALVAVLLHHRPHIVACAGAIVIVATVRDGARSWPWWTACIVAGLLRIPLFVRWGGVVSPDFQERAGLGLRMESLTYLLVALLPCTLLLLWGAVKREGGRARVVLVGVGAAVGLVLGLTALPDLDATAGGRLVFMGAVATTLGPLGDSTLACAAFVALSALGGACLAATLAAPGGERDGVVRGAVLRVAAGTAILGWSMYGLTRGAVYDRYLLPFVAYFPLLWTLRLPWPLRVVQGAGLLILLVKLTMSWLS